MPPKRDSTSSKNTKATKTKAPATKAGGRKAKKEAEAVKEEENQSNADITVSWTNELSSTLLTAISEDNDIKQGLFPAPGGNVSTARGGGQKKTAWQWKLAIAIFQNHEEYGTAFQKALDLPKGTPPATKAKSIWADKIKNRLKKMEKIVREHMATLGSTGEGIKSEAEIDMSQGNQFVNKWAEVKSDCPWFFEMRALIAERPNVIPVGIGNSETVIDTSVLDNVNISAVSQNDDGEDYATTEGDFTSDGGMLLDDAANEVMMSSEADYTVPAKRKTASESDEDLQHQPTGTSVKEESETVELDSITSNRTLARIGTSKPASIKPSAAKKSKLEEFAAAAREEEITRQKEIDLKRSKIELAAKIRLQEKQMETQLQQEKIAAKAKEREQKAAIKLAKLQLKMERIKAQNHSSKAAPQLGGKEEETQGTEM
ncbi:hypothetical protein CPC08DRAFT_824795 [Agrocybe pediades]|nr:hypothetical protein CPC08DRAFT_824795 [Agrocybe pediades]